MPAWAETSRVVVEAFFLVVRLNVREFHVRAVHNVPFVGYEKLKTVILVVLFKLLLFFRVNSQNIRYILRNNLQKVTGYIWIVFKNNPLFF